MLRARVTQAKNIRSVIGLSGIGGGVLGDNPPSLWAKILIISYWLQAIGVYIQNNEIDTQYPVAVSEEFSSRNLFLSLLSTLKVTVSGY